MKKILAFIKKGFLETINYRVYFIFNLLVIFILVTFWYYLCKAFENRIDGADLFSYFLIGAGFARYITHGVIRGFAYNPMKEIERGTLESNWATPTRPLTIIIYSAVWDFIYVSFQVLLILLAGKVFFGANIHMENFIPALPVVFLFIVCCIFIGVILSSFILIFKHLEPFTGFVEILFSLLGGAYFPIHVLPQALQDISKFLPITYALNALRAVLMKNASLSDIGSDLSALLIFIIFLFPLSFLIFDYALSRNRITGNFISY